MASAEIDVKFAPRRQEREEPSEPGKRNRRRRRRNNGKRRNAPHAGANRKGEGRRHPPPAERSHRKKMHAVRKVVSAVTSKRVLHPEIARWANVLTAPDSFTPGNGPTEGVRAPRVTVADTCPLVAGYDATGTVIQGTDEPWNTATGSPTRVPFAVAILLRPSSNVAGEENPESDTSHNCVYATAPVYKGSGGNIYIPNILAGTNAYPFPGTQGITGSNVWQPVSYNRNKKAGSLLSMANDACLSGAMVRVSAPQNYAIGSVVVGGAVQLGPNGIFSTGQFDAYTNATGGVNSPYFGLIPVNEPFNDSTGQAAFTLTADYLLTPDESFTSTTGEIGAVGRYIGGLVTPVTGRFPTLLSCGLAANQLADAVQDLVISSLIREINFLRGRQVIADPLAATIREPSVDQDRTVFESSRISRLAPPSTPGFLPFNNKYVQYADPNDTATIVIVTFINTSAAPIANTSVPVTWQANVYGDIVATNEWRVAAAACPGVSSVVNIVNGVSKSTHATSQPHSFASFCRFFKHIGSDIKSTVEKISGFVKKAKAVTDAVGEVAEVL